MPSTTQSMRHQLSKVDPCDRVFSLEAATAGWICGPTSIHAGSSAGAAHDASAQRQATTAMRSKDRRPGASPADAAHDAASASSGRACGLPQNAFPVAMDTSLSPVVMRAERAFRRGHGPLRRQAYQKTPTRRNNKKYTRYPAGTQAFQSVSPATYSSDERGGGGRRPSTSCMKYPTRLTSRLSQPGWMREKSAG